MAKAPVTLLQIKYMKDFNHSRIHLVSFIKQRIYLLGFSSITKCSRFARDYPQALRHFSTSSLQEKSISVRCQFEIKELIVTSVGQSHLIVEQLSTIAFKYGSLITKIELIGRYSSARSVRNYKAIVLRHFPFHL